MAVNPSNKISQVDMATLATLANSKTTLPKYITPGSPGSGNLNYAFPDWSGAARDSGSNPKWLTELNRLRGNLFSLFGTAALHSVFTTVSGAVGIGFWPITGAGQTELGPSSSILSNVGFVYPDSGATVSLAAKSIGYDTGGILFPDLAAYDNYATTISKTFRATMVIGGADNVIFSGGLNFPSGVSDPSCTLSCATSFPIGNGSWSKNSYGQFYADSNSVSVAPGIYHFDFTLTTSDTSGGIYAMGISDYLSDHSYHIASGGGQVTITFTAPSPISGIHNALPLKIIMGSIGTGSTGYGFGIHSITTNFDPSDPNSAYFSAEQNGLNSWIATGATGIFVAQTAPISSLNAATPALMPWNLIRTKYGSTVSVSENPALLGDLAPDSPTNTARISNSYNQSLSVELQQEPPGWIAGRYFSLGFNIMDSNGNLQIVAVAGTSGGTHPVWPLIEGGTVADGDPTYGVGWQCRSVLAAAVAFTPKTHRDLSVPVYPFYWQGNTTLATTWAATNAYALNATVIDANGNTQNCTAAGTSAGTAPVWNQTLAGTTTDGGVTWTLITLIAETNDFLKPPTATSGLTRWGANIQWQRNTYHAPSYDPGWHQDNLAIGWWIYTVSFNRIQPGSAVSVTIGCIRSGSFVAFGTYATGQTVQVLWPVFTSDALAYQCAERIDIQAVAISSGGAGVSVGATAAGYPVCAAFVSDVTALLALIT